MRCPLCGFEFDATEMSCHSSCAFNAGCAIICCPNCGYQVADEGKSHVAAALRRLFARRMSREELPPVRALSMMLPGESGKVIAIDSQNHTRVERLHVMGLVPDATVTLQQRRPTFVLKVGFTELSIERAIADEILVEVAAAVS